MNLEDPRCHYGLMPMAADAAVAPDLLRGRGRGLGPSPRSPLSCEASPRLSTWPPRSGPVLLSVAPAPAGREDGQRVHLALSRQIGHVPGDSLWAPKVLLPLPPSCSAPTPRERRTCLHLPSPWAGWSRGVLQQGHPVPETGLLHTDGPCLGLCSRGHGHIDFRVTDKIPLPRLLLISHRAMAKL